MPANPLDDDPDEVWTRKMIEVLERHAKARAAAPFDDPFRQKAARADG